MLSESRPSLGLLGHATETEGYNGLANLLAQLVHQFLNQIPSVRC